MPGSRTAVLLTALALATAVPAAAQSPVLTLNLVPPQGWTESTRPNVPGLWKDWAIRDGSAVHSIVMSVTHERDAAEAHAKAFAESTRARKEATLLESAPATTCGDVPGYGVTYRVTLADGRALVIRHLFVDIAGLLGDISYAHPPDAGDRADALDALSTFCERRIYAMRAPDGWRSGGMQATGRPGVDGYLAPAGGGVLIALAVPAPTSVRERMLMPGGLRGGATMIAEKFETCGDTRVHRVTFSADGTVAEQVSGYRHGASYVYAYTRPQSTPPDAAAESALTSFCAPGATLATPPPASPPPAAPSPSPA